MGFERLEQSSASAESEPIDTEALELYREWHEYGPRVGDASIINRETGEAVFADVRVDEVGDSEGRYERFNICADDRRLAFVALRHDEAPEQLPNYPETYYGNNPNDRKPKVFIVIADSESGNSRYKKLGWSLAEIAVERSLRGKGEGRVQLQAAWDSFGFWEKFGFQGQDIYDPDGALMQSGRKFHDLLVEALAREQRAGAGQMRPSLHLKKEDAAYMFLPDEAVKREKERVENKQHLAVNGRTIQELLLKHNALREQGERLKKAEKLWEEWEKEGGEEQDKTRSLADWIGLERIAELFAEGGARERARELYAQILPQYEAAAKEKEKKSERRNAARAFGDAAEVARKMQDEQQARELWERAGNLAEDGGDLSEALDYYTNAANVRKVGEIYAKIEGIAYREW